jgi:hypothetical protein
MDDPPSDGRSVLTFNDVSKRIRVNSFLRTPSGGSWWELLTGDCGWCDLPAFVVAAERLWKQDNDGEVWR